MSVLESRGALSTSWELGEQLLRLAQRAAEPMYLLEAHNKRGLTFFFLGDYAAARMPLEQRIALIDRETQRTQALWQGEASGVRCLITMANTLWALGYPSQAMQRSQETRNREIAHLFSLSMAQQWAALLYYRCREVSMVQVQAEALLNVAAAQ